MTTQQGKRWLFVGSLVFLVAYAIGDPDQLIWRALVHVGVALGGFVGKMVHALNTPEGIAFAALVGIASFVLSAWMWSRPRDSSR